jgi:SPP1 gp7 family putative phage head morphogenesis protein
MAEARKMLTGSDLQEFKWDVNQYIQYGHENALMGNWTKELENASAKFHISRLEALKMQTQNSLETMFNKQLGLVSSTLGNVYQSGYYHTAYELQSGFGIGWDIAGLDQSQIEKILSKPWAVDGKNFSERIWSNKEKLINEVHNELSRNILTGSDPQKAIDAIAKKMNTSKTNAGRLVMTEEAYFSSAAQKDCFGDLGVEQYEIVATLDSHTSEICQSLDGQVFSMKDFEPGVTAPPFHVNCRSTTVPYFDDDFGQIGERAARDEEGNTYYVPDNMKYKDWKETFVDGGDKSGFDVYQQNGVTHYKQHTEPEPEKPKKEYLTKKKLQANIANADVQIEDLDQQFSDVMKEDGGLSWNEFKTDYQHDYSQITDNADELSKLQAIGEKIDALEAQKAEWEEKLQEKLVAEQKKALTKQQMELEAQKAALQKQLDDFEIKTYSGIWKDDVTTADWGSLNIEGKKKYYEGKFLTETDTDLMQKYQDLYKQLQEFDTEGKSYYDVQQEMKKIESEISKVQSDLKKVENGGIIDAVDETFSQARKDAALWFDKSHGGFRAADAYFDPVAQAVHGAATKAEHKGFYTYTQGSGGHNRPLAGFEKPWSEYGTGWEAKFFKGSKNVWIDYEGKGNEIRGLTTLIEKSTYDSDIWLQSGQDFATIEGVFQIPYGTLSKMTDAELQVLVGEERTIEQFLSAAVNEGGGSMFNSKPMKLNIYAPKGSQMLYASDVGAFGKGENEMILQRGGTYKITKIYWGNDATDGNARKIFVDMELHPEKGYDLFQQDPSEWTGSKKTYRD